MRETETALGLIFIGLLIIYALTHSTLGYDLEKAIDKQHEVLDEGITEFMDNTIPSSQNVEANKDYSIKSLVLDIFGGD